MTKKTMSEGKTLEEANNINKSLMVLGTYVIMRHVNGKTRTRDRRWPVPLDPESGRVSAGDGLPGKNTIRP